MVEGAGAGARRGGRSRGGGGRRSRGGGGRRWCARGVVECGDDVRRLHAATKRGDDARRRWTRRGREDAAREGAPAGAGRRRAARRRRGARTWGIMGSEASIPC